MRTLAAINSRTRVCAVIGHPLGHTLSPAIHNAAFDALELDFVYVAFPVRNADAALTALRHLENLRGLSVTIPHKTVILDQVDEVGEIDRQIGSINTVVKDEDGRLRGLGTDGPGALKALRDAGVEVADRRVLFLGAGGAARAIAFTLGRQAAPTSIRLIDVDAEVRERLAADLRDGLDLPIEAAPSTDVHIAAQVKVADIVIHCTPVGMHPHIDHTLLPADCLHPDQVVFDVVYNPLRTRLLQDAERRGCRTIVGAEMFVNQAVLQFEVFTGQPAPVEVMRKVVLDHLAS